MNLPLARWTAERRVTLVVAMAVVLAPLNSTMIAVALPRIIDGFQITVPLAGWLVTGYLISMASMQPLAGKLGDRFGRRRIMLAGLAAFGGASLLAAFAPNYQTLLAARFLQALAGASSMPNGAALIREIVPAERRGRGFGMVGVFTGIAAASGPPLGGLFVDIAGWRSIFLVNVPVVAVALLAGWVWIPRSARPPQTTQKTGHFDYIGAVLLPTILVGVASLLIFGVRGIVEPWVVGLWLAAAVLATVGFVIFEMRHPDPVLQPSMYRNRSFAAANVAIGLSNLAMYTTLLGIPILLGARRGESDFQIGLVLTGLSMGMAVLAPVSGRLTDRYGRRLPSILGLTILTAGSLLLVLLGPEIGIAGLVAALLVSGIGLGIAGTGLQTSAVESVASGHAGTGSGMSSTSRYFGSIVGSSILAGLIAGNGTSGAATEGFQELFMVIAIASAISTLAAVALRAHPARETADEAPTARSPAPQEATP